MGIHADGGGPRLSAVSGGLIWKLGAPHISLGWPLIGGGRSVISRVEWHFATADDLTPEVDAATWLRGRLAYPAGTAAFLTSRRLDSVDSVSVETAEGPVIAVATVGLGNALRAGDPAQIRPSPIGTINLAVRLPVPMTEEAHLEALVIGQEAKSIAVMESGVCSVISQDPASGTGTDCAVVLAPPPGRSPSHAFAGKHTELGSAIGRAAHGAVAKGAAKWKAERGVGVPEGKHLPPCGTPRLILVGGGVRSGKSRFAEHRTLAFGDPHGGARPVYIATSRVHDGEMAERVERHKRDRGDRFETLEVPMELCSALRDLGRRAGGPPSACMVECLTLWLSNLLCAGLDDAAVEARIARLLSTSTSAPFPIVFVSNEVGLGIVPESALARRFRDHSGRLHQALGRDAREVYFAALGMVQRLKPGPTMTMPPC